MTIRILISVLLASIILMLGGCAQKDDDKVGHVWFYRKIAREDCTDIDGWVYTFTNEDLKMGINLDGIPYTFSGINLRYAYDDNYAVTTIIEEESKRYISKYYNGILIFGRGSEQQDRDNQLISSILQRSRSVKELLALNPEDYSFEVLDNELFFRLMHEALTGERHQEGKRQSYWDKPSYAMLAEKEWQEGTKWQIGFLMGCGCVDIVYIDLRYKTGEGYKDYVQLSDMVDEGTANTQQREAFALIQQIRQAIVSEDNFIAKSDDYKNTIIDDIDFNRLYVFLYNIHVNKYNSYIPDPVIVSTDIQ